MRRPEGRDAPEGADTQVNLPYLLCNATILVSIPMLSSFFKGLARHYGDWKQQRRAYEELYALDERSLADIGITRSEIPYVLARAPGRDERPAAQPAKRPASGLRRAA